MTRENEEEGERREQERKQGGGKGRGSGRGTAHAMLATAADDAYGLPAPAPRDCRAVRFTHAA